MSSRRPATSKTSEPSACGHPIAGAQPHYLCGNRHDSGQQAALMHPVTDGTTDIIVGCRPVSDWDGLVRDYFAAGGEQI